MMPLWRAFVTGFVRGLAKMGCVVVYLLMLEPGCIRAEWQLIDEWEFLS